MTGGRDMRDPEKLGRAYMRLRTHGMPIAEAVRCPADDYADPGPLARYPRDTELIVTTTYRRQPIEKLALVDLDDIPVCEAGRS